MISRKDSEDHRRGSKQSELLVQIIVGIIIVLICISIIYLVTIVFKQLHKADLLDCIKTESVNIVPVQKIINIFNSP